jgi:hypothetical protein
VSPITGCSSYLYFEKKKTEKRKQKKENRKKKTEKRKGKSRFFR